MMNENLSRDEAIAIVGESAVDFVETTSAVQKGTLRRDGKVEFESCIRCKDKDGESCILSAVWLMDGDDVNRVEDLSDLDWDECDHYEVA